MKKVKINTPTSNYEVHIGNVIEVLKSYLKTNQKILVITDENVRGLHLQKLKEIIDFPYLFSLGHNPEASKNLEMYEKCVQYALDNFLDRNILVIAFGGGTVGDFAGFFASTYKRGVDFIQIPTTLLAHDSAIGGKTALNIGNTKNGIGTFYQPISVIYHLPFLTTLHNKEIINGFGEIIKHDLLSDGYLLNEVMNEDYPLKKYLSSQSELEEIIYRAIIVKKLYIEMDIYDNKGQRQFLNFGHTLGHAIEILYDIPHGEAISLGLCFDLYLSNHPFSQLLYQKLLKWGYFSGDYQFNEYEICRIIKNDKKNSEKLISFIGLKEIGVPYEIKVTDEEFMQQFWNFKRLL